MTIIISIVGILLTIFFVIGTHEAAHFLAARALGVKVLTFSIGFGKTLLHWHDKKGTEYIFALIPLGGYVRMLDENEGTVSPEEKHMAFNRQPFYKKFLIVLAGPLTNILCAFILYWLLFVIGFVTVKPIIGTVAPQSIAAQAGLQAKQEIVAMDGRESLSWTNIIFRLLSHLGDKETVNLTTLNPVTKTTATHTLDLTHWHIDELKPDPLASLGITAYEPVIPLIIGTIAPGSAAASSDLKMGDKIIAIDKTKVNHWNDVITTIYNNPGKTISITIQRQGKTLSLPVTIGIKRNLIWQPHGVLGIGPHFVWPKDMQQPVKYGPIAAIPRAWQEITDFTYFNLVLFGKMITGKLSLQSLGGPITIFETAGDAFHSGFLAYISFLAFLSISIGIINFLPIPGLDGGHLFIQIIELITRRPIPERYLLFLFRAGFVFILFILFQALANDILRMY